MKTSYVHGTHAQPVHFWRAADRIGSSWAYRAGGLFVTLFLTVLGCGGSDVSPVNTLNPGTAASAGAEAQAGQGGQNAGAGGATTAGASGSAGSIELTTVCLHVEAMPVPDGEAEQGRLFLRRPDGLWLLSGIGVPSKYEQDNYPSTGGIFQWQPESGWQRYAQASLGDDLGQIYPGDTMPRGYWMAGARWAASIDDTPAFADVSLVLYSPVDFETRARETLGLLYRLDGFPLTWMYQNGGSYNALDITTPSLVYPDGVRTRLLGFAATGDLEVEDIYPNQEPHVKIMSPPAGIDMPTPVDNLRWTAAQRWHVRSGRGLPVAVLDLDALSFKAFTELPSLQGDVAAASDGPVVWLFGQPKSGPSALYRVDASLAQAEQVPLTGLPQAAGKPWHEAQAEDVLVALDAQHLLLLQARFGQLDAFELDLTAGQAHPVQWQGDASLGQALFQPPPVDKPDPLNGFRPGDTLRAVAWSADEALMMRQFGAFAGVRVRRGCTP